MRRDGHDQRRLKSGGVKVQGSGRWPAGAAAISRMLLFKFSPHICTISALSRWFHAVSSSVSIVALFTNLFLHHDGITCSTHMIWQQNRQASCVMCALRKKTPPPVFIHNSHFLYSPFSMVWMETGCLVVVAVVPFWRLLVPIIVHR